MPTSFGGRRNFTSWGVTLSCPPGAEQLKEFLSSTPPEREFLSSTPPEGEFLSSASEGVESSSHQLLFRFEGVESSSLQLPKEWRVRVFSF